MTGQISRTHERYVVDKIYKRFPTTKKIIKKNDIAIIDKYWEPCQFTLDIGASKVSCSSSVIKCLHLK